MSEPALPNVVIMRIVDAIRGNPGERSSLIASYLPLLISYVTGLLQDRRVFARFRYAFENQWRIVFPDIPPPDYEGVFNYDTLVNKFYSYILSSEERRLKVYVSLKLTDRIVSAAMIEATIRMALAEILFNTVVDVLRFVGEIGYPHTRPTSSLVGSRLFKASPPPLTSIAVTVDLADAGLDRSLPLLDRFNLVATAVRLATNITEIPIRFRKLASTSLCDLYKIHLDTDICSQPNPVEQLDEIVGKLDKGEIPITEEIITLIAQTIIITVTPLLDETAKKMRELAKIESW